MKISVLFQSFFQLLELCGVHLLLRSEIDDGERGSDLFCCDYLMTQFVANEEIGSEKEEKYAEQQGGNELAERGLGTFESVFSRLFLR